MMRCLQCIRPTGHPTLLHTWLPSQEGQLISDQEACAILQRQLLRQHALFSSHLFDVRVRFQLRQCWQTLRAYAASRTCARSVCSASERKGETTLDSLELDEEFEHRTQAMDTRIRKSHEMYAAHVLRIRQRGLLRLCFMALRSHTRLATGLRGSCAATFIAHRLVGRGVVSIVLRVWRQHVVQLQTTRQLHSQLGSVVNERLQAAEMHYNAMLKRQAEVAQRQLVAMRCRFADAAVTASQRATLATCWWVLRLHTASNQMMRERRSWREVFQQHTFESPNASGRAVAAQ